MKFSFKFGVLCSVLLVALIAFSTPVFADSKNESLRPLDAETTEATDNDDAAPEAAATSKILEKKYRAELEKRLAQERESYEGSLTSLWLANAGVWGILCLFIVMQAISARKRAKELARLKALRQGESA